MKLFRLLIISLVVPALCFSAEKAKVVEEKPQEQVQEPTPPAQSTQQATQKTQNVTVNGMGVTFIVLAIGGILIAALQGGGTVAH